MNQKRNTRKTLNITDPKMIRIVFRVPEPFKIELDVHLAQRQETLKEFGARAFAAQLKREGAAA